MEDLARIRPHERIYTLEDLALKYQLTAAELTKSSVRDARDDQNFYLYNNERINRTARNDNSI